MFKKISMLVLALFMAQVSFAEDANSALAVKLADSMHMTDQINGMRAQTQASNQRQIEQILAQLQKSVPQMTEAQRAEVRTAADKFMASLSESWSSQAATNIYTTELTKNLPEEDIRKIVDFYGSKEGQKALTVTGNAQKAMVAYITASQEKAMAENYGIFLENLKKIMTPATNKK